VRDLFAAWASLRLSPKVIKAMAIGFLNITSSFRLNYGQRSTNYANAHESMSTLIFCCFRTCRISFNQTGRKTINELCDNWWPKQVARKESRWDFLFKVDRTTHHRHGSRVCALVGRPYEWDTHPFVVVRPPAPEFIIKESGEKNTEKLSTIFESCWGGLTKEGRYINNFKISKKSIGWKVPPIT
jgi:hypothetical protein